MYELFGVKVPLICMPVAPGRNLSTLVEVAARNQLLRSRGLNAARDFVNRLEQQLQDEESESDPEEEPRSGGSR
jgi:HPr kinase/phosphorylase